MKFATWNVNGIRARASQVQEWLERERPDVVCLQELKAELAQVPEIVRREDYHASGTAARAIRECHCSFAKRCSPPSRSTAILRSTSNLAS